jgi:hypothetical protein
MDALNQFCTALLIGRTVPIRFSGLYALAHAVSSDCTPHCANPKRKLSFKASYTWISCVLNQHFSPEEQTRLIKRNSSRKRSEYAVAGTPACPDDENCYNYFDSDDCSYNHTSQVQEIIGTDETTSQKRRKCSRECQILLRDNDSYENNIALVRRSRRQLQLPPREPTVQDIDCCIQKKAVPSTSYFLLG